MSRPPYPPRETLAAPLSPAARRLDLEEGRAAGRFLQKCRGGRFVGWPWCWKKWPKSLIVHNNVGVKNPTARRCHPTHCLFLPTSLFSDTPRRAVLLSLFSLIIKEKEREKQRQARKRAIQHGEKTVLEASNTICHIPTHPTRVLEWLMLCIHCEKRHFFSHSNIQRKNLSPYLLRPIESDINAVVSDLNIATEGTQ